MKVSAQSSRVIEQENLYCLLCDEQLTDESSGNSDHLIKECRAVKGPVVKEPVIEIF